MPAPNRQIWPELWPAMVYALLVDDYGLSHGRAKVYALAPHVAIG